MEAEEFNFSRWFILNILVPITPFLLKMVFVINGNQKNGIENQNF
jgi:hypothetical protein